MDAPRHTTDYKPTYSLWHIPSSTLLTATALRDEAASQLQRALARGCQIEDLMLQIVAEGELVGSQHLGASIAAALRTADEPDPTTPSPAGGMPLR